MAPYRMIAHASSVPFHVNIGPHVGLSDTACPTKIEASSRMTPKIDASPTRPGRMTRM